MTGLLRSLLDRRRAAGPLATLLRDPGTVRAAAAAFALAGRGPGWSPCAAMVDRDTVTVRMAGPLDVPPEPGEPWRVGHDPRVWIVDRADLPDEPDRPTHPVLIGHFRRRDPSRGGGEDSGRRDPSGGGGEGSGRRDPSRGSDASGGGGPTGGGDGEPGRTGSSGGDGRRGPAGGGRRGRFRGDAVRDSVVFIDGTESQPADVVGDGEAADRLRTLLDGQLPDDDDRRGSVWPVGVEGGVIRFIGLAIGTVLSEVDSRRAAELLRRVDSAASVPADDLLDGVPADEVPADGMPAAGAAGDGAAGDGVPEDVPAATAVRPCAHTASPTAPVPDGERATREVPEPRRADAGRWVNDWSALRMPLRAAPSTGGPDAVPAPREPDAPAPREPDAGPKLPPRRPGASWPRRGGAAEPEATDTGSSPEPGPRRPARHEALAFEPEPAVPAEATGTGGTTEATGAGGDEPSAGSRFRGGRPAAPPEDPVDGSWMDGLAVSSAEPRPGE